MKKFVLTSLSGLLALSMMTASQGTQQNPELNINEINSVIGQWDYNLVTKDGIKIKGFFQIAPTNKGELPVVGQTYFDKGDKTLTAQNLRGVWTGSMQKGEQPKSYVLSFLMQGNPLYPSTPAESPYRGVINVHFEDAGLAGTFTDHDSREGVSGTIVAHRHQ